jgi:hypothetical protein
MRRAPAYILGVLLATGVCWAGAAQPLSPAVRFQAVAVFVETGDVPLAAYQLDLQATTGNVRIVGIEGGKHPAFADPPYYDPAAIQGDRVIIGAFSTAPAGSLPTGRTRIATIHVQVSGDRNPEYKAELSVAATADGAAIPGRLTLDMEPQR